MRILALITGTSCAGKSTLIKKFENENISIISADVIFDSFKKDFSGPWKNIKPLVLPKMIDIIDDEINKPNFCVFIDDNKLNILDYFKNITTILIFCKLKKLAKNSFKRDAGDSRSLTGIMKDYIYFYKSENKNKITDCNDSITNKSTNKSKNKSTNRSTNKSTINNKKHIVLEKLCHNDIVAFFSHDSKLSNEKINSLALKYSQKLKLSTTNSNIKHNIVAKKQYNYIFKNNNKNSLSEIKNNILRIITN